MFGIPLHKLIIHFPIALTIMALIYDGWGIYARRPRLHETGYGLSLWAAATGLGAVTTGLLLAGVSRIESGVLTGHTAFGLAAGIAATVLGFWRYTAQVKNVKDYQSGWFVLQVAAAILTIAAAITGHRLIY